MFIHIFSVIFLGVLGAWVFVTLVYDCIVTSMYKLMCRRLSQFEKCNKNKKNSKK